jgi:poly(A) polymerase
MITEREFAVEVVRKLQSAGHQALFAGGCVRDELLGLVPKDHDVATSARPQQVQALFRRTVAVGVSFGVIDVLGPRPLRIQVATFRNDGGYSDARRPDSVTFSNAEEDAKRRDFTINGLFLDPLSGEVFDYVGGRKDLQDGILRAIGDPRARFREDRLRLLRAVRIAARFVLSIDPATWDAIREMAPKVSEGVSPERIAEELRKTLENPNRARAMRLLRDLGLADAILPEVPAGAPWERTLASLEELRPDASFPLAMAALLAEAENVEGIATRLRLSNDEGRRIAWLVQSQGALERARKMPPSKLKPLLAHPEAQDLIDLHRAQGRDVSAAEELRIRWLADGSLDPPPLLTGNDLIGMGMRQGPGFKVILTRVRDAQLNGEVATREEALALARLLAAELG